jgi:signal transduction histidine kinase
MGNTEKKNQRDDSINNQANNTPSDSLISALTDANKSLRRKIFDLFTIFEISRHLNSMLDLESLLDAILFTCIGQMGVSGASIIVMDPETGEISKFRSKGMTIPPGIKIMISRVGPLARFLQRNSKPHRIYDLQNEIPEKSDDYRMLTEFDIELVVPLVTKGDLVGILFLPSKLSGEALRDEDLEFVSILVNQLSVALENANMYENERKALAELKSTQKRLIETERLAALGTLSASIAHEVNNPLAIIKNYLTIIERLSGDGGEIKTHVSVVQEEVNRIAGIVKQLLDFYRPSLPVKIDVDLCTILKSTLELLRVRLSDTGINVVRDFADESCRITGSPDKLKQVFLNILLNARDAMPDGGDIIITEKIDGDRVEISFADTGCGIDEKNLPHIFEPFYTSGKESGTGLGLSVCYGIIRSHEGSITASRNHFGGATFSIKLPIKKDDVAE